MITGFVVVEHDRHVSDRATFHFTIGDARAVVDAFVASYADREYEWAQTRPHGSVFRLSTGDDGPWVRVDEVSVREPPELAVVRDQLATARGILNLCRAEVSTRTRALIDGFDEPTAPVEVNPDDLAGHLVDGDTVISAAVLLVDKDDDMHVGFAGRDDTVAGLRAMLGVLDAAYHKAINAAIARNAVKHGKDTTP